MRDVLKTEELEIPEGVDVQIKSRQIKVTGPRGTLTKNVRHVDMDIRIIKGAKANKVTLAVWQGGRKHVACLRTIKSLIQNMVTGVTKVRFVSEEEFGLDGVERGKGADDGLDYRASNTKCAPSTPISTSTASSRTAARHWRSGISSARRCVASYLDLELLLIVLLDRPPRSDA